VSAANGGPVSAAKGAAVSAAKGGPVSVRHFWALAAAVALLALALRLPFPEPLEPGQVMQVARSVRFAERGAFGPGDWDGPWLGPLLTWPALAALGPTRLALALPGALAAAAAVLLLAALGRRLLGGAAPALLAAALLALDTVAVDAARRGRPEALAAAFLVGALAAALRWREAGRLRWLLAAGAALGLGCAASGAALAPLLALALALAGPALWRNWQAPGSAQGEAALALAGLVAVPAAVALLSLLPWFLAGHGPGDLPDLAEAVLLAVRAPPGPGATAPATWFLLPPAPGARAPNPATWLLALPALAWLTSQSLAPRPAWPGAGSAWLAALLAAAAYLPLLAAERAAPLEAALPALPFLFLAVAGGVCAIADRRRLGWLPGVYLALAFGVPLIWSTLG